MVSQDEYAYPSPIGDLSLFVDDAGAVVRLRFGRSSGPPLVSVHPQVAGALDGYFRRGRDLAGVRVAPAVSEFHGAVLEALRAIPPGEVRTYSEVATGVASPAARRAVGRACALNPIPLIIPCHRVVASSGLGGYQAGLSTKIALLRAEGSIAAAALGAASFGG